MTSPLAYIIVATTLLSCSIVKNGGQIQLSANSRVHKDSTLLLISALNLSEDVSKISSKNDEIIILIYELNEGTPLAIPIFTGETTFDKINPKKGYYWKTNKNQPAEKLVLFLIELDDELPTVGIDSTLRKNYTEIIKHYNNRNPLEIKKFLGDEDLLGVQVVERVKKKKNYVFRLSGMDKLDTYEYRFKIKNW